MTECKWGRDDCVNLDDKCHLCHIEDFYYIEPKLKKGLKKRNTNRQDKRMGSTFEYQNHITNKELVSSDMTINSGASYQKGDEQITGIINIMEELKTKVKKQAPGKESFTIKKEWLNKLNTEAKQAKKEFWYLKFAFHETEEDVYVITEQDIIMSMVKTMIEDRKFKIESEKDIKIKEKQRRLVEAENVKLKSEIDYLKSVIDKLQDDKDDKFKFEI